MGNNWFTALVVALTIVILAGLVIGHIADFNKHGHEHAHPEAIHQDQKVCIDGRGFFPYGMPEPSPFMVCGEIEGLIEELETVEPPPLYEEGSHRLEGVDRQS